MTKSERKVSAAFREVNRNEPGIVAHTRAKYGSRRAAKQKVAIALSKARKAGAKVPRVETNPLSPGAYLVGGDLGRGYRPLGKA
jgi:Family of unknown function (DUF6496)